MAASVEAAEGVVEVVAEDEAEDRADNVGDEEAALDWNNVSYEDAADRCLCGEEGALPSPTYVKP